MSDQNEEISEQVIACDIQWTSLLKVNKIISKEVNKCMGKICFKETHCSNMLKL